MVGFDALEDAEFGKLGGAATDGVLMSFPPKAEDDPKNAALVKKFRDAKYEPADTRCFTYAAVKVWADAAKKANSIEAAKVAAALRAGHVRLGGRPADLRPEGRHQGSGLRHLQSGRAASPSAATK
jgi:ABC-type branched-subunit amino acid transport system substrate-binding protein